ncbi:MAG TPA: hypothetical protein DE061_02805 [Clostridiales bacterium]|nr:hypothetical protein [Clostridiales bacterium]HCH92598.1 hypothetical protein [Clostridiales bacterium]
MSIPNMEFLLYFIQILSMSRKMDIRKIVGNNLKSARKAMGLTQKQIADELGKYQPDYSEYETGKIELDYEKIIYLCKRLDITPNDLFEIK